MSDVEGKNQGEKQRSLFLVYLKASIRKLTADWIFQFPEDDAPSMRLIPGFSFRVIFDV